MRRGVEEHSDTCIMVMLANGKISFVHTSKPDTYRDDVEKISEKERSGQSKRRRKTKDMERRRVEGK